MDVPGYALITGAGSGIGQMTSRRFAQDGSAGIAIIDINRTGLEETKAIAQSVATYPGFRITVHELDVTNEAEVYRVIDCIRQDFGRIDYLAHVAGVGFKNIGGVARANTKDWTRVLNINLDGTFFVLRAATRLMLTQSRLKSAIDGRELQRGSIVNVASWTGLSGLSHSTAYCTSKHAVVGLTRTAARDYAADGLRINAVCPGYINTPLTRSTPELVKAMQERATTWAPMGRPGEPEELADSIMYLCGGRSSFVTGTAHVVDGGGLC